MAKKNKGKEPKSEELRIVEAIGDGAWVLVPLAALMIPILAVSDGVAGGSAIPLAVAVTMVMVVGAVLARMLMAQRHSLRMRELQAERAIAEAEARQMSQANQVIENNRTIQELRQAVASADSPQVATAAVSQPISKAEQ